MLLTTTLLLLAAVLLTLALVDRALRTLPLTPALLYLVVGIAAGALLGAPDPDQLQRRADLVVVATEAAVLVSLLAVGLRLRVPPTWRAWRVALLMAGPGMVATIALGAAAAVLVLGLPWPAALLLAAILAPTDPVLASEVQIRHEQDRDAVRLSLTAEGGLNDGSALPAVMLGLGLLGLHELGEAGSRWWWWDFVWPVGGGALIGIATGWGLGLALRTRLRRGDGIARDELLYVGAVALAFGLARATATSTFVVMFAVGVTLLLPLREGPVSEAAEALSQRLGAFGARIERLVEAATVLSVGLALNSLPPTARTVIFGLVLVLLVRPLAVLAVVRAPAMGHHQRRLVAWFGIRGIGTLYYMAFAVAHGVHGALGKALMDAALTAIALSIVLHGVSATPVMEAYQRRRQAAGTRPPGR